MNVIVLYSEAFEELKREFKGYVKAALTELLCEKQVADNSDWISIADAMKLLPYKSKTTWQKFRDTGIIKFTQTKNGRNILYSRKSIVEFLNKNTVNFK